MTHCLQAWWQRARDLHSRSRVRVRACISCKSLGQPRFYSLTWAHKVRFPGSGVSSNPKKKKKCQKNHSAEMIKLLIRNLKWIKRHWLSYTILSSLSRQGNSPLWLHFFIYVEMGFINWNKNKTLFVMLGIGYLLMNSNKINSKNFIKKTEQEHLLGSGWYPELKVQWGPRRVGLDEVAWAQPSKAWAQARSPSSCMAHALHPHGLETAPRAQHAWV